mgnify:CR=1 FL=1
MTDFEDFDSLARRVDDGALVALAPDYSWVPMALVRALIRQSKKNLHLLTVPIGGMAADMLIGAGAVKTLEAAAVSLGEAGAGDLDPRGDRRDSPRLGPEPHGHGRSPRTDLPGHP